MRQRILITGASSGLGRGMALQFAARGRALALCARRLPLLESLRDELRARYPGIRVAIRALDVCDFDRVTPCFAELQEEIGGLDRVIVNAGVRHAAPVGRAQAAVNRVTVQTNFVAALAQCEAAMQTFRAQNSGHLVLISSMAGLRGLPGAKAVYAASKAGLATLGEGLQADVWGTPIRVSVIYPGYIRSGDSTDARPRPFVVDTITGCRALVGAIEAEPARAYVPRWPWAPIAWLMRRAPLRVLRWTV